MSNEGARLQALQTRGIQKLGQQLTVTRKPVTVAGASTTQTVWFAIEPLTLKTAAFMTQEANMNVAQDEAHDFMCAGTEDVRETVDVITYNGFKWRVFTVIPEVAAGVKVALHCVATRQGV